MCPGSALAAGDDTPARPSGKRTTLSTNAEGLERATGRTTGTHDQHHPGHVPPHGLPPLPVGGRPHGEEHQWPGGELEGRRRPEGETAEERSSPLEGDEAQEHERHHRHIVAPRGQGQGRGGEHGQDLEGAHPGIGRRPESAEGQQRDHRREQQELDAGVGQPGLDPAPGGEPEDHHPGQVGVVELVDGFGVLVDQDVAVPVHHAVGVLAVGSPVAGLFDHDDLGLDVEGGIALGAPDDLHGQRHDGGPEQNDQEGDHPGHLPTSPAGGGTGDGSGPIRAEATARRRSQRSDRPNGHHRHQDGGGGVGPDGHLAPLPVERYPHGQRGDAGEQCRAPVEERVPAFRCERLQDLERPADGGRVGRPTHPVGGRCRTPVHPQAVGQHGRGYHWWSPPPGAEADLSARPIGTGRRRLGTGGQANSDR